MRKKAARILALFCALVLLPLNSMGVALPAWGAASDLTATGLTVQPLDIIEYTWGQWIGDSYVYNEFYADFSVTFSDGRTLTSENGYVTIDEERYYLEADIIGQFSEPWTVGNTYTVPVELLGAQANMTVHVVESPVESLTVQDMTVMENMDGYMNGDVFFYTLSPQYTLKLKDGREYTTTSSSVEVDGEGYSFDINAEELQREQSWTAGNTYTVSAAFMGVSATFHVTVQATPVASVTVKGVSIIDGTHGEVQPDGHFRYELTNAPDSFRPEFEVALKNGQKLQSENGYVKIDNEWLPLAVSFPDQSESPWTVGGTYEADGWFMGVHAPIEVRIVKNPIAALHTEALTLMEGGNEGYYDFDAGEFKYYRDDMLEFMMQFSVELADGTVIRSEAGRLVPDLAAGGQGIALYIDNVCYGNCTMDAEDYLTLSVGENTLPVEFMGAKADLSVTVKKSPVVGLKIDDITLVRGVDSEPNGNVDWYNLYPTVTLTMQDGSQMVVNEDDVRIGETVMRLQVNLDQWSQPLKVGETYTVTGAFGVLSDTFTITVLDSPVECVEFIRPPQKATYVVGEVLNLKGAVLRVHYTDGTYEDVSVTRDDYGRELIACYTSEKLNRTYYLFKDSMWLNEGQESVNVYILGQTVACPVTVQPSPWTNLTIANGADGNLLITLTNDDGASETMTVWQLIPLRDGWSDDIQQRGGVLVTDKGSFDGTFYYTSDMTLQLKAFGLTSNTLASCGWIRVWSSMENYWSILTNTFDSLTFDGTVTAANIDQLIIYVTEMENLSIENVGGDELREAFATWLGLDEVDLSLSAYYDAESDTYQRPVESYYRVTTPRCMGTVYRCVDGAWQISATFVDGSTMTVTLDNNLCVRAAEHTAEATSVLYGDANGDGKVTTADAALILQYAAELIGDGSLSAAAADVNGDGKVTTADAALVLQYAAELITQFPAAK